MCVYAHVNACLGLSMFSYIQMLIKFRNWVQLVVICVRVCMFSRYLFYCCKIVLTTLLPASLWCQHCWHTYLCLIYVHFESLIKLMLTFYIFILLTFYIQFIFTFQQAWNFLHKQAHGIFFVESSYTTEIGRLFIILIKNHVRKTIIQISTKNWVLFSVPFV